MCTAYKDVIMWFWRDRICGWKLYRTDCIKGDWFLLP